MPQKHFASSNSHYVSEPFSC